MTDTIAAIATPPGRGGIGVVRLSGPKALEIALDLTKRTDIPKRSAILAQFFGLDENIIDQGIVLYFVKPASFTGENVVEFQGHGGPVVMQLLLARLVQLGARVARPGEFSERAFLNGKLDLTQAEAIADLIDAQTQAAVRAANRSLQGEFSAQINAFVQALIALRVYVEAAIDFPEEEIDFLTDGKIQADLLALIQQLNAIRGKAEGGRILRDGINMVIAGPPNAGKSSLLNVLSGQDSAIVTPIPGTTRDVLREKIAIEGIPVHLIDTAGLRQSDDLVEQEGIRRAEQQIAQADIVLWVYDAKQDPTNKTFTRNQFPPELPIIFIRNKIDLASETESKRETEQGLEIALSAKLNQGIMLFKTYFLERFGLEETGEGTFSARQRHLNALNEAAEHLALGKTQLADFAAGEILAEELRLVQQAVGQITGEFSSDALLGEIFSSFCIGK